MRYNIIIYSTHSNLNRSNYHCINCYLRIPEHFLIRQIKLRIVRSVLTAEKLCKNNRRYGESEETIHVGNQASTRKECQGALSEYHEVMACFYLNDEQKAHIF